MLPDAAVTRKEAKERREGSFSRFLKSQSAASTVILAVLLLGLTFTVISVIKLEYVPEWKDDAERNHIHATWDDMVGVKTRIDILSRFMNSKSNYPAYGFSTITPFNMGGGEIPFLEPSKSKGRLEVNTQRCAMTVTPRSLTNSTNEAINLYTLECGGITYYSENREYTDQAFRYENGALITANGEHSIMRQPPAFTIEEDEPNKGGNYIVTIQAVQLSGKPNSISSNTITPLQLIGDRTKLIYDSNDYKNTSTNINAFNLTIATKYPDAWITYFIEIAQEKGLNYTVQYLPESDSVCFSFLPTGNKTIERLYVNKAIIRTDIGAGKGFDYSYNAGWTGKEMRLNKWYFFDTFNGTYNGTALSPSPDPLILRDYDPSKSPLPSGNSDGVELTPYSPQNNFSKYLYQNDNLQFTFGFNDYANFDLKPSQATILMIYRYDNEVTDKNGVPISPPKMEIWLKGKRLTTVTPVPSNKWMLYSDTFSVSPISPSDLEFTLKVDEGNKGKGTFRIDYLKVYLS